jgi:hypothetical protein
MAHAHHLHEDQLFECYLAARSGESIDPPSAEHLADCEVCASDYGRLAAFLDGVRAEADAETDAIFTPDRLRAQQQQIAKRLEHVGRAARVLSFPARSTHDLPSRTARFAPKWLAAAAAAGVIVGIGLGASYEWVPRARTTTVMASARRRSPARATHLAPVATRGTTTPQIGDDDAFLSDLDLALEHPQTRELIPFDALTPHVRDVSVPIR